GPKYVPTAGSRAMQAEHLARLKKLDRYPFPEPFANQDDLAKQILASSVIPALKTAVLATAADVGRSTRRVPTPSEQAPYDFVDRPELTSPLLAYLLSDEPVPTGRAVISAVHGLGGIGKTTVARWLVWRPEVEQRFLDGRIW